MENQAHSNKDRHRRNLSKASYKIQNAVNHWLFGAPGFTHSWEEPWNSLFQNGTSRGHLKSKGSKNKRNQIKTYTDKRSPQQTQRFRKELIFDCSMHQGSPITGRSLGTTFLNGTSRTQARASRSKNKLWNKDRHTQNLTLNKKTHITKNFEGHLSKGTSLSLQDRMGRKIGSFK